MGNRNEGLKAKYYVERLDGKPLKGGHCVVLEFGDPNAWSAIKDFAASVEKVGYYALAKDLRTEVEAQIQKHIDSEKED